MSDTGIEPHPALRPFEPFAASDFDEACEECEAPAGSFCRTGCPCGYTAADARADAARQLLYREGRRVASHIPKW